MEKLSGAPSPIGKNCLDATIRRSRSIPPTGADHFSLVVGLDILELSPSSAIPLPIVKTPTRHPRWRRDSGGF